MNASAPFFTVEPYQPKPNKVAGSLRFRMFADIEAAPRKLYIVDGLLGEGELSAFAGAPGSGKSVLAGDLACHKSAGMDWMGRRVRRPHGVLYIAAERAALTERRFAAWRKYYNVDDLPLAVVAGSVDFLHNRDHVNEVLAYGERLTKATGVSLGLIIVDTVSRALAGGDENGPKDMGAFVGNIGALQDASGAHILLIHHVPQGEGATRLRGHGALLGAVDTLITIEKGGESRIATLSKDNDGAEGASFSFNLESVELHVDEEGFVTTAPVVIAAAEPAHAAKRERWPKSLRIFKAALDAVLAENAVKMRPFLDGPEVLTATRNRVRDEFLRRYPAEDRKTKNTAFGRSERAAMTDGLIACREIGEAENIETVMWSLAP